MKALCLSFFFLLLFAGISCGQNTPFTGDKKLYDPNADAKADIAKAVEQAGREGKHVFLQIGGNWCKWCFLFDEKVRTNDTLRVTMEENYVVYHLNYSKENKNEEVLKSLGFPQRFGFPVFVILDGQGTRLHTQNSAYLEQGQGHSTEKVLEFLNGWSPAALDPQQYEK
ncbi:MAG: thioredoxin family protein [Saprospiraceae bacterium]